MITLLDIALLLVALFTVGVSIFSANFARQQADAAGRQVKAAREQADIAREQADAARAQVAEAKRANDLTEAEIARVRAQEAVKWEARATPNWKAVRVTNRGREVARNVVVSRYGDNDPWADHEDDDAYEEVPPNEHVDYRLMGHISPPEKLWVSWDGAERPTAVDVERGKPPGRLVTF